MILPKTFKYSTINKKKEKNQMYKNIEKKKILDLKIQIEYQQGQVVSKTLVQNELVSATIFSFDKLKLEINSKKVDNCHSIIYFLL